MDSSIDDDDHLLIKYNRLKEELRRKERKLKKIKAVDSLKSHVKERLKCQISSNNIRTDKEIRSNRTCNSRKNVTFQLPPGEECVSVGYASCELPLLFGLNNQNVENMHGNQDSVVYPSTLSTVSEINNSKLQNHSSGDQRCISNQEPMRCLNSSPEELQSRSQLLDVQIAFEVVCKCVSLADEQISANVQQVNDKLDVWCDAELHSRLTDANRSCADLNGKKFRVPPVKTNDPSKIDFPSGFYLKNCVTMLKDSIIDTDFITVKKESMFFVCTQNKILILAVDSPDDEVCSWSPQAGEIINAVKAMPSAILTTNRCSSRVILRIHKIAFDGNVRWNYWSKCTDKLWGCIPNPINSNINEISQLQSATDCQICPLNDTDGMSFIVATVRQSNSVLHKISVDGKSKFIGSVDETLKFIVSIDGLPSAVLTVSDDTIYIWNHNNLKLQCKLPLCCLVNIRNIFGAIAEQGLLFLIHSSASSILCVTVINPINGVIKSLYNSIDVEPRMMSHRRNLEFLTIYDESCIYLFDARSYKLSSKVELFMQDSKSTVTSVCCSNSIMLIGLNNGVVHIYKLIS